MFDTSICVYLLRRKNLDPLVLRMNAHPQSAFVLSSITIAELDFGVSKSQDPHKNTEALAEFLAPFTMLPFDNDAAFTYGDVRAHLERAGTSIGPLDTLIAAHALSRTLILVTNNEREFRRVPGLKVENWTQP